MRSACRPERWLSFTTNASGRSCLQDVRNWRQDAADRSDRISRNFLKTGGEGGIQIQGNGKGTTRFAAARFNRSAAAD